MAQNDPEIDQQIAQIQNETDLEDFLAYYEFNENEKNDIRQDWHQSRAANGGVQDRGLGNLLLAGGGAVLGYYTVKKLMGGKKGKKKPWRPGMGGMGTMGGMALGGLAGAGIGAAASHFAQPQGQPGYGAPPGAYGAPPGYGYGHKDMPGSEMNAYGAAPYGSAPYGQPAPYGAPPSGSFVPPPGAPAPGYGAPAPGYGAPAPGYGAPAPGYGAPPSVAPGYGAPPGAYGAPPPAPYGQPSPYPGVNPFPGVGAQPGPYGAPYGAPYGGAPQPYNQQSAYAPMGGY